MKTNVQNETRSLIAGNRPEPDRYDHYRIRYRDTDGGEVPVMEASLFSLFINGWHARDFPCLGDANGWIEEARGGKPRRVFKVAEKTYRRAVARTDRKFSLADCRVSVACDRNHKGMLIVSFPEPETAAGKMIKKLCRCYDR